MVWLADCVLVGVAVPLLVTEDVALSDADAEALGVPLCVGVDEKVDVLLEVSEGEGVCAVLSVPDALCVSDALCVREPLLLGVSEGDCVPLAVSLGVGAWLGVDVLVMSVENVCEGLRV